MVLMDTKAQSCLYLRGWANPDRERPLQGDPPGGSELPILESRSLADDDQSRHQVFSGDSDNPAGLGCARVFQAALGPPWGQTEFQVNLKLGLTSHACI